MSAIMKSSIPYLAGAGALIVILVVVAGALYGQSRDAKLLAKSAEEKVLGLVKTLDGYQASIDELTERQQLSMATLAARAEHDAAMQGQLSALRRDLNGVMSNDPESAKWGAEPIPDAILKRLRNSSDDRSWSAENNQRVTTAISDR